MTANKFSQSYRILLVLALTGLTIMGYFLYLAVIHGNLASEGPHLVDMPWGFLSLIDIYTGLILISYWVYWRS